MYYIVTALLVYLAAVMETSLVDVIRIGEITPDLLALVAVVWLLAANGPGAFLVAGGIALVGDLIAPGRVGVGMGWMLLVGYVVTRLRNRQWGATSGRGFVWDRLPGQVLTVGVAVTVWAVAVGLSGRLLGDVALSWLTIVWRAAGVGLYTAGVGLPVLIVLGWIRQPALARERRLAGF
jgi:hypothetical protein